MNIGTFVRYRLSEADVRNITFRRARAVGWAGDHEIKAGDDFPAMVVKVVALDVLDLRVFLNGTDDLWKANVCRQEDLPDGETRGGWAHLPNDAPAAPAEPPAERTLRINPGDAPRTVKARKEGADV